MIEGRAAIERIDFCKVNSLVSLSPDAFATLNRRILNQ